MPKPLIDQVALGHDVELEVRDGGIFIQPASTTPRAGWEEAARRLGQRGEDGLIDAPTSTRFDEEEWDW